MCICEEINDVLFSIAGQHHTWREMFDIAVKYRRLVDPEYPVLWLDKMPDHRNKDGYKTVITLVRYVQ